jgi:hypothetical protein
MSLETINASGIGYTSLSHYPLNGGEEDALRPEVPTDRSYNDAKSKIVDATIQCNLKRLQQPMTGNKTATIEITRVKEIKSYIQRIHVDKRIGGYHQDKYRHE